MNAPLPADLVGRLRDADMGDDHGTQKLLMDAADEIERLRWLLGQIISELPQKRDWFNPDIEREVRERLRALDVTCEHGIKAGTHCPKCDAMDSKHSPRTNEP
jgi:hypothetical protein